MSHALVVTGCHRELVASETVPPLRQMLDHRLAAHPDLTLIEGEAPQVDTWAREWAKARGVAFEPFPIEDFYRKCTACDGRGGKCRTCKGTGSFFVPYAGPNRNKAMVKRGLEFETYSGLGVWEWTSRGTWGCMQLMAGHGYPVTLLDMRNPSHPVVNHWTTDQAPDLFKWLTDHEPPRTRRRRRK